MRPPFPHHCCFSNSNRAEKCAKNSDRAEGVFRIITGRRFPHHHCFSRNTNRADPKNGNDAETAAKNSNHAESQLRKSVEIRQTSFRAIGKPPIFVRFCVRTALFAFGENNSARTPPQRGLCIILIEGRTPDSSRPTPDKKLNHPTSCDSHHMPCVL
jgi:hypothetical protein